MTELETVLAGLLRLEDIRPSWGRAESEDVAQYLAPHIERAFRDAGRHGRPEWNDLWAIDVGTESLREALNDER